MENFIVTILVALFITAIIFAICDSASFGDNDFDRDARDAKRKNRRVR